MATQENRQTFFFISDGTGITAEVLGNSLISRFEHLAIEQVTLPYINTLEKAQEVVTRINEQDKPFPAVAIISVISPEIRKVVKSANILVLDIFEAFLSPLEQLFSCKADSTPGKAFNAKTTNYLHRIEAMNYALENDDGCNVKKYHEADVIIVGLSRSGKTPTSLYLSMHFGILAANYPLTEDDFERGDLPESLINHNKKLFGLIIDPDRLTTIREKRYSRSRYASIQQCEFEYRELEKLYRRYNIPFLNSTYLSIEELSTRIMLEFGIERRIGT